MPSVSAFALRLTFLCALLMSPVTPVLAETGTLTVSGEGSVQSVPDMAALSLGVTSEGASAGAAMSANAAALRQVLDRLAAAGIEPRDIQTSNLSLNPTWTGHETGAPRITSYTAMNFLTVTARDLAALGPVIDAAIGAGANTLNGIEFRLSAPEASMAEARRLAVADAMARAETLAGAAGVRLGPILSITEGSGQGTPLPMYRAETAMDAGTPTAAGQVGVSASVTLVFALEQ